VLKHSFVFADLAEKKRSTLLTRLVAEKPTAKIETVAAAAAR
jgi:hypothetical protein